MAIRYLLGAAMFATIMPVGVARAQDHDQEERPITLVGCVMRESVYRDTYGPGLSGPRGPGIGIRDEYMLVDAHETTADATVPAGEAACPAIGTTFPTAYELTGPREKEIAEYVGRRVVLTGIQKEANVRPVGTSGTLRPTGGFDPLGHEMHLFEVEIDRFREMTPALAAAPPAAPERVEAPAPEVAPAPEPVPEVAVAAPEPAPAPEPAAPAPQAQAEQPQPEQPRQVAEAQLPRTAGPLPLAGFLGLLSLAGAVTARSLRRRH